MGASPAGFQPFFAMPLKRSIFNSRAQNAMAVCYVEGGECVYQQGSEDDDSGASRSVAGSRRMACIIVPSFST